MVGRPEFVEQLFEVALALEPAEREPFLRQACADDLDLKRTIEDLLAQDASAGSFLEHPPFELFSQAEIAAPRNGVTTGSLQGNEHASAPAGRFEPGQLLLDRFLILRFIAKGGMGEVYEAEDGFLQGVHVALKIILPQIAEDPALQQRFEREVLLAREVSHPNLCPIYDIFRCEQPPPNFLFLTMRLLPGETLATRLRNTTSIAVAEGQAILKQMASGLAAIHAAGIIHRDIKPNNIMLDGTGPDVRLFITDFGLARAFQAEPSFSEKGLVAGTPDYMAPELFLGRQPSQATDLFAFGIVLHQVFTGQKPTATPDGSSVTVSPRLNSLGLPSFCVQLIVGCLDADPKRRCDAFERARAPLHIGYRTGALWSRRQFAGAALGAISALAGVAWWKRDQWEDLLRPLPSKRFVALLNWPTTSDIHVTPMLTSVLSAIKTELTHFETLDRDLFVISPEDVSMNVAGVTHLKEVTDPLGVNLVLAASALPGPTHFHLFLRLLEPSSSEPLREKEVTCPVAEITSLPAKAVQAAASLLDLVPYLQQGVQAEPGTQSSSAFTAFQLAETLMKQPNDAGLDAAIEKYKQATDLDPRYAIAHARLALAYCRLYATRRENGALQLAQGNADLALALNYGLLDAHLAAAAVLSQTGDDQGELREIARALALDPSNPKTLVWQAQAYTRLDRWQDAEKTLRRVLKDHPNYWLAYHELGFCLHSQAKYGQAIQAFQAASLAAPKNAMVLGNLGGEYVETGEFNQAREVLQRSLVLNPESDLAAVSTSLALRLQGQYDEALTFARKAVELNPADDTNWLELADCYASLHGRHQESKDAFLRAATEAERHLRTDAANGPGWMLLALYKVKGGDGQEAPLLMAKAESLGARDMDSQMYKVRILELLGRREEALALLAACFRKGATQWQVAPFPDMQSLKKDPRYLEIKSRKAGAG